MVAHDAKGKIDPQTLPDDARSEAAKIILIREIRVAPLRQVALLLVGEEAHGEGFRFRRAEDGGLQPDGFQLAEPPPRRPAIDSEVDIRGVGLDTHTQVMIDVLEGVQDSVGGFSRDHLAGDFVNDAWAYVLATSEHGRSMSHDSTVSPDAGAKSVPTSASVKANRCHP
jgi:hypothetical protein